MSTVLEEFGEVMFDLEVDEDLKLLEALIQEAFIDEATEGTEII